MSVPGWEPLSRPPRVGDPVKVVVEGHVAEICTVDGVECAYVELGLADNMVSVPLEKVWNQARPDKAKEGSPADAHPG
jgi:hypothetical protein